MSKSVLNIAAIDRPNVKSSEAIRIFSELIKFRITVLVSFTTGLGYILGAKEISFTFLAAVSGIFLLACASSSLNHWQERDTDALMDRTRFRPIPSGRISSANVLIISLVLLLSGSAILALFTNSATLFVGLAAFVWYNGIYTPLKKISSFAIIPGAVVGALPPIAGWTAVGGYFMDYRILIIAIYMFIWQIPHFWLLLLMYGEDYQKGGFPTLKKVFNEDQLKRITFAWLLATILVALLIPFFLYIYSPVTLPIIFIVSAVMGFISFRFLFSALEKRDIRNSFIAINFYTLLLISILSIDKLTGVF